MLALAAALTMITGIGFGVLPALRACGGIEAAALQEGSRGGVGGRREQLRGLLVVAAITVSVALSIASGLLIRALWRVQGTPTGFHSQGVLTLRTSLTMPNYNATARRTQFYGQVLSEIKRLPSVTQAAFISFLPIAASVGVFTVVRSSMDPAALLPAVRQIIARADPEQPISDVQTLAEVVATDTAPRVAQVRVLGTFTVVALLLAGIGIHGLLSFAVSHRAPEIGVRMAMGAQSRDILAMILREGLWLTAAGTVLGVVLAYAAGRGLEATLAGVKPSDLPTFAIVVGVSVVMTLVGSLLPALRAIRVDPLTVMRVE